MTKKNSIKERFEIRRKKYLESREGWATRRARELGVDRNVIIGIIATS